MLLNWATGFERNNDYFEIEKSSDGIEFVSIGKIEGNGNSPELNHYVFEDEKLSSTINYYRLKQVDYDGAFSYSTIISVSKTKTTILLSPNPAKEHTILYINSTKVAYLSYKLYDLRGQSILSGETALQTGGTTIEVSLKELAPGTYRMVGFTEDEMIVNTSVLVY